MFVCAFLFFSWRVLLREENRTLQESKLKRTESKLEEKTAEVRELREKEHLLNGSLRETHRLLAAEEGECKSLVSLFFFLVSFSSLSTAWLIALCVAAPQKKQVQELTKAREELEERRGEEIKWRAEMAAMEGRLLRKKEKLDSLVCCSLCFCFFVLFSTLRHSLLCACSEPLSCMCADASPHTTSAFPVYFPILPSEKKKRETMRGIERSTGSKSEEVAVLLEKVRFAEREKELQEETVAQCRAKIQSLVSSPSPAPLASRSRF